MIKICRLFASIFLFVTCFVSPVFSFEGPLQTNNLYPLFLHADQPYLEKAELENSMSFSLSHSSTYTVKTSREWIVNLDLEITELNLRYKKIIKDVFELDIDIPLLYFGAGFMDGPLETYHDAFGFSDYGRRSRPHDDFLYEVRRDGKLIIEGKSGARLGDIRLAVKKSLVSADDYKLSLKGDIEIPVSSAEKGYSNGSLDAGISLLIDKGITDNIMTHWNLGAVFPGDIRAHEKVDLQNFIFGGLAIEAILKENLGLLIQLHGQSEIYPDTEISAVDGTAFLIALGGRYFKDKQSFELSLTEDLNTSGAPDFILNFTYKLLL